MQYFTYAGNYDGASDPDQDGVTNAVEFVDGTIPNDVSSAKYFLTLSGYNGSAGKTPDLLKYDRGTTVTLTNTPQASHAFLGWQRVGGYAIDFAVKVTGTVTIPADGTYTFGVSCPDGARLKVNGSEIITKDVGVEFDGFGQITLVAGTYPIELTVFEYTNTALELFAAPGSHASFNSSFKLLGDVVNGGLAVQTLSSASTVPGLTVQQMFSVTGNIFSLARMDELIAGTRPKRAEATIIAQRINYLGGDLVLEHFSGNANFPFYQPDSTNPLSLGMYGDYTVATLNTIPLADAVDAPSLTFTTTGEVPWLGELSGLAQDNVDHAGSGPITHNQSSTMSTTVTGPGTLTFRWKVSSEAGGDRLQFLMNDSFLQQISGEEAYAQANFSVPEGPQTLTWRYVKDGAVSSGADRGWVDQINFGPVRYTLTVNASGGTVNVSPQQADYAPGTEVSLAATAGGGNTFIGWSGDLTGSANPTNLILDDNKTVTAIFGLGLPVALDTPGRVYNQGGNASWYGQTLTTHDGADAGQSGDITENEETLFDTTVTGPGSVSFWWKVSSESNFDWLEFYIDDVLQTGRISGDVDWTQTTYAVVGDGPHTLRWRYSKDYSLSDGADAGFVDQLEWTPSGVTYASWMGTWFTAGEMGDPQITGASADPNKDGIPNLLAYALNLPPTGHGTPLAGVVSAIIHNNGTDKRLRMTVNLPDPLPGDVTCTIECSNGLGSAASWIPIATGTAAGGWTGDASITEDAPVSGRRSIHVRDTQIISAQSRRFIRLKVSQ